MLFGGFAPPAARQTSAVFFIVIAPTEILHFYLELAISFLVLVPNCEDYGTNGFYPNYYSYICTPKRRICRSQLFAREQGIYDTKKIDLWTVEIL